MLDFAALNQELQDMKEKVQGVINKNNALMHPNENAKKKLSQSKKK